MPGHLLLSKTKAELKVRSTWKLASPGRLAQGETRPQSGDVCSRGDSPSMM